MVDILSPEHRSRLMSRIRGKDTRPEMIVRRIAHGLGFRYRLHRRDLPGTPDLVFVSRRKVIFVHGCFWHGHTGCRLAYVPKTRTEFWIKKISDNRRRDTAAVRRLRAQGWSVAIVWECETRRPDGLATRIRGFLASGRKPALSQKA